MISEQHIHLVSDATGETINGIARACLAQFEKANVQEHYWNLIRTGRQLKLVLESISQSPGLVLYTFVDDELRKILKEFCKNNNIASVSVLEPVMTAMSDFFGIQSSQNPGRQHVMDAEYFSRIEAMDFTLALDDGNKPEHISKADIIVLGVSRTSKTPTCIYLANRGIRAANIPIIPGVPLNINFSTLKKPFIVGLTKDPDSLVEIRRNRLHMLQQDEKTQYIDVEQVRKEVLEARKLFTRIGCPVIDVSRRSIEETASEILMLYNKRELDLKKASQNYTTETELK